MALSVNALAPLSAELEIKTTGLFSVVCLKGEDISVEAPAAEEKPAAKPAAAAEEDDDDWGPFYRLRLEGVGDDDMFGDDDGDDDAAAAAAAKLAEAKAKVEARAAAKIAAGKSLVVFEIKPYDVETDLEKLAASIRALGDFNGGIQNWGQEHKLVPVAFGVKKLVMSCVIFDMKISLDDITDKLSEDFEDDIQSIDIQSMSKV